MTGQNEKTLRSERLTYRLLCADDKDTLRGLLADRSVTEPAGFLPAETEAAFDRFFAGLVRHNACIAILRDDKLIGYVNVHKYRPDLPEFAGKRCVSTGFVVGKPYQDRGYGTEALKTVTALLKNHCDLCFADHFEDNIPSRKVIEKCGYRYVEKYTVYFEELGRDITCLSYVY